MTRSAFLLLLSLAVTASASAEVHVGLLAGTLFPGRQDVTVKEFDEEGLLLSTTENPRVSISGDEFIGVTLEVWRSAARSLGIRVDALRWESSFELESPEGEMTRISQVHGALVVSLTGRVPLPWRGATIHGGLGAGLVDHRIRGFGQNTGGAINLLAGAAVPVIERLRVRLDLKYLITADLDARGTEGVHFETSGSRTSRSGRSLFGPHQDTRFLVLALGLDWRL